MHFETVFVSSDFITYSATNQNRFNNFGRELYLLNFEVHLSNERFESKNVGALCTANDDERQSKSGHNSLLSASVFKWVKNGTYQAG